MSKMSDIAMTIEELRNATAVITEAVNWLAEQFSGPAEEESVKEEKKPELKLEDVRAVLAEKSFLLCSNSYTCSLHEPSA